MLSFFLLNILLTSVLALNRGTPWIKGFNVANTAPGSTGLKNASDWDLAFQTIKALPGNFNAAKVYSTTDGGPDNLHHYLPDILPAAVRNDIHLILGMWLGDGVRFDRELAALHDGLAQFPNATNQIVAICVGSEDLYRKETNAAAIVGWIAEVRELFADSGCTQSPLITHADTWQMWLEPENTALINTVDFITVNAFPFWENDTTIDVAASQFWGAINKVVTMADKLEDGASLDVWVGETGWATNFNFDQAVGSVANLQHYWNDVVCGEGQASSSLFNVLNGFYFIDRDNWNQQSFGVLGPDNKPIIDLDCSWAK